MKCEKCGAELINGDKFCQNCGAPISNETSNVANNNMNGGYPNNQNFSNGMNGGFGNQSFNNNMGMYGNGYNGQGQITKGYSNNTAKVLIIVGPILFGIICLVVFLLLAKKSEYSYNSSSSGSSSTNDGITQTVSSNYYTAYLGSFELQIPTNIIYEKKGNQLVLYDSSDSWIILVDIFDGSFAELKSNMGQMKAYAESQGMSITDPVEKTQNGINFITFETVESGYNEIVAYAKADEDYYFGFSIVKQDSSIDYSMLNKVTPIISSAKNTGSDSNSIKLDGDFGASKKAALVK